MNDNEIVKRDKIGSKLFYGIFFIVLGAAFVVICIIAAFHEEEHVFTNAWWYILLILGIGTIIASIFYLKIVLKHHKERNK